MPGAFDMHPKENKIAPLINGLIHILSTDKDSRSNIVKKIKI